jgi:protein-S-isoprenylcysteine O-methyltransferase Ste14
MKMDRKLAVSHILLTFTSVGQILAAGLTYRQPVNTALRNSGWIILWIAGLFGLLPVLTFKILGKVKKGESYVHTNRLVDRGVYSIVRHPQYLAGILISIGLGMIAPGWINSILGIANIAQYYSGTFEEEERLIAKFGQEYSAYQKKVPRLNPILGLIKKIFRR